MIESIGRRAAAVTTAVLAISGLGSAWQTSAQAQANPRAATLSTDLTCNIGDLGQTAAVLNAWLTAPGNSFDGPARFWLHVSSLSLQAPFPIDSWSGTAWVNVTGTENTAFQVSGSGGAVPAQGALTGDLAGDWAPAVSGTHLLSVDGIEVTVNSAQAGTIAVQCVPNGTPVAEVLQVAAPYRGSWIRPWAPRFHAGPWYHPGMILHRPVWDRPGWNRHDWDRRDWDRHDWDRHDWNRRDWNHPDWHRPDWHNPPVYHRPVDLGGGWHRPGPPIHHGG